MKNKRFWIALALCFIPYIIGLAFYHQLPDPMPSHWNIAGEVDGYTAKNLFLFGLPTFMILIFIVCVFATKADPKSENIPPLMMNLVYAIVPILSNVMYVLCINAALPNGLNISISSVVPALLGIMFIVIGNYLPKCKQSYTVGIRTPWTLDDHEIWNKTHRLGGFVFMFMGVVMLCTCFLPEKMILIIELPIIFISTLVPIVYSYVLYKKKCKGNK